MSRQYQTVGPDGAATLSPPHSDYINQYSMNGSAAQTVTWPSWATFCNIAGTANYYVGAAGNAAIIPAAGITNGTGSALNVAQRRRSENETSFSIISGTAQYITVEFWGG